MASCPWLSFTGITPEVVSRCVKFANQFGANIPDPPPPMDQRTVDRFTFTWSWNPVRETVIIGCTRVPSGVRCGPINDEIISTMEKCGGLPV